MDRNGERGEGAEGESSSLSARRAWIEISWAQSMSIRPTVALRKESVDRNIC